ncbi:MAG: hypothetical protein ACTMUP_08905 [cyanobacterium endosymbiont of Rhopalodia musculus]
MFNFPANILVVTVTKGLFYRKIHTICQIWQEFFLDYPIVVLSRLNFFKEMEKKLQATKILASTNERTVEKIQNVMTITLEVCDGLHLGTNTKSAMLKRA